MSNESDTELAIENHARKTMEYLRNGQVGSSTVRDLGEAVNRATRDIGVGQAIGNTKPR